MSVKLETIKEIDIDDKLEIINEPSIDKAIDKIEVLYNAVYYMNSFLLKKNKIEFKIVKKLIIEEEIKIIFKELEGPNVYSIISIPFLKELKKERALLYSLKKWILNASSHRDLIEQSLILSDLNSIGFERDNNYKKNGILVSSLRADERENYNKLFPVNNDKLDQINEYIKEKVRAI